jgi:hypothetical protein
MANGIETRIAWTFNTRRLCLVSVAIDDRFCGAAQAHLDSLSADPFFHPLHCSRHTAAGDASATDATISTMSAENFILYRQTNPSDRRYLPAVDRYPIQTKVSTVGSTRPTSDYPFLRRNSLLYQSIYIHPFSSIYPCTSSADSTAYIPQARSGSPSSWHIHIYPGKQSRRYCRASRSEPFPFTRNNIYIHARAQNFGDPESSVSMECSR